jgi:hypothetical protein
VVGSFRSPAEIYRAYGWRRRVGPFAAIPGGSTHHFWRLDAPFLAARRTIPGGSTHHSWRLDA